MGAEPVLKKLLVIANKSWEADPLVSVLTNPQLRPPTCLDSWSPGPCGLFSTPGGARATLESSGPRLIIKTPADTVTNVPIATIEIWCIEDWMVGANHSSSKAKNQQAIPTILKGCPDPDFVVALGTASFPDPGFYNGCVIAGTNTYMFNPYRNPPAGTIHDLTLDYDDPDKVGHLLASAGGQAVFTLLSSNPNVRLSIDSHLSPVPSFGAAPPTFVPAANYVALSDLNITNYDDYVWADPTALKDCLTTNPTHPVGSVETTHGLIRAMTTAPFLFLSGITNRLGYLNQEQAPRSVAQNFIAAHNAGVALAWLIPLILRSLSAPSL